MYIKDADLSVLVQLIAPKSDDQKTLDGEKQNFSTGKDSKVFPLIEKILKKYISFENEKIDIASFLEAKVPYDIHTDYNLKGDKPANVYLIPVDDCKSATIIFNQECTTNFDDFKSKSSGIYFSETLEKYKDILAHCSNDDLKYVSVKSYEKWEKGKIISWNRKLLHASDNFIGNGIDKKFAITIFTSYKE